MAKTGTHVVTEGRVWIVEGRRRDNGNGLYYLVWAGTPDKAMAYLLNTALKGIAVTFTSCHELSLGRYEMTINCKRDHPERYQGQGW